MDLNTYLKTGDKNLILRIKVRELTKFYISHHLIGQNIIYETGEIPIIIPPAGIHGLPSDSVVAQTVFGLVPNPGISEKYSRGDHTHGTPPFEKINWNAVGGNSEILNKPPILLFSGFAKISVGTIPPINPQTGDLWVDIN